MSLPPPRIACLMYHEVTDDPGSSGFQRPAARRYTLTRAAFALHLERIAAGLGGREGATPRLVTDLDLHHPGRHVLLTFDDGGASALYAAEALARRGWRGHFFIITGRIGERTFLSAPGIRELRAGGHLVGSHSHTHPDIFRDLSPARMVAEWRTSADRLEQLLGEPCVAASIPGGDSSPAALESAAAAGFRYCFTSDPWLVPQSTGGCWILGRLGVKAGTSPATIASLVAFHGWRRAQLERRVKDWVRRGAGPLYRWYVRYGTRTLPIADRDRERPAPTSGSATAS